MQKKEWNAFIRDNLAKGNETDTKISVMDWRIVDLYIERSITSRLGDMVADQTKPGKMQPDLSFLDLYTKTYKNIPMQYDADRDKYYSYFPPVIQLPGDNSFRSITRMQDETDSIGLKMPNNALRAFNKLEVSQVITDIIPFFVEGNKLYYVNLREPDTTMLFKLIIPYSDFDDYDEIPEPYFRGAIAQQGSGDVLDGVIAQLRMYKVDPTIKEDKVNQNQEV